MLLTTGVSCGEHGRGPGRDRDLIADLQRGHLIIQHHERGGRQHFHVRDPAQGVEDQPRLGFAADQEIEPGQNASDERLLWRPGRGCGWGKDDRAFVATKTNVAASEKELDAILQLLVEGDFRDRGFDRDLQAAAGRAGAASVR